MLMETKFTKKSEKPKGELQFLLNLDHPNIVRILDLEELSAEESLITMEDVPGSTLKAFADENGGLSADDTIHVGMELCRAVEYLHGLTPPWLYCDMKPENVMVTGHPGQIEKIVIVDIDGGCPMVLDGLVPEKSFGTKNYAAPEQQNLTGPLDYRVDVYGICATLDAVFKRHHIIKNRREAALDKIIKKGMQKDPKDRYFTVKELHAELGAI